MSEQQFLDELKKLKTETLKTCETVHELATRNVNEKEDEEKQECFLNMWKELTKSVEQMELMIESIESKTFICSDDFL